MSDANVVISQSQISNTSINPVLNWDKPFWRSTVSSEFGTGSTARVCTLAIVAATLGMLIYLIIRNNSIPDNIMYLGWFSALLISVVYSPSKIVGIFKSWFSKK